MILPSPRSPLDRSVLLSWYRKNRQRSRGLFDLLTEDAYYTKPIGLRHPIVFYDGHLPAFSFITVVKRALGGAAIDEDLERLFARGIDPERHTDADRHSPSAWPGRAEVRAFADEADRRVMEAIEYGDIDEPGHPFLNHAEAVFAILEHEQMHQETLLYMWHRLPFDQKRCPAGYVPVVSGQIPVQEWIDVPSGRATLGVDAGARSFSWDNERPSYSEVVGDFEMERHNVTNAAYLEFVEAGGYADERWWLPAEWTWIREEGVTHPLFWQSEGADWFWRGMFERLPLPLSWPVYVSHAEASAYARWRGCRLPTEAEYQRAAFGEPSGAERPYAWGDEPPQPERHGVFDFSSWDPQPAGSHPEGRSAFGIDDLVGNGWEWTSSIFKPFPGFRVLPSYPEYSADFFDGEHFVMKGASSATARELLRPSFRNWFRPRYPYVYASFRGVKERR